MSFQQIRRTYHQNIQHTHTQSDATAELSLHPHLRTFVEKTTEFLGHENRDYIRATQARYWQTGFCCEKWLTSGRLY